MLKTTQWLRRSVERWVSHCFSRQVLLNVGTLVAVALMLGAYHTWAAPDPVPQSQTVSNASTGLLSYQGYLTDTGGEPLHGDVDITFQLYSVPTEGTALWTETHTGENAVPVTDGLFNVMLGSLTPIPKSVWNSGARYLSIQVGDDAEMTPRETIGNVPAALTVPDHSITEEKIAADVTGRWTYLTDSIHTNWSGMGDQDWTDLTLEDIPTTATAVLVQLSVKDSAGNAHFWMRPDGCTQAAGGAVEAFSPSANIWNAGRGIVKLGAGNVVEYHWNAAGSDTLTAVIKIWGYYEPVGN